MSKTAIINTVDKVWLYLGDHGKTSINTLLDKTKAKPELMHQAIGWLACEDRIKFNMRARTVYVSLSTHDTKAYKRNQILPPCCG